MAAILGLHQFSTPGFSIPDVPAEERPLHKIKDFASFLNSLQWKADEPEESPLDSDVDTPKHFANPEVKNREQAEQRMMGLDPTLSSGNDVTLGVGKTRWDGHDTKDFDTNGWLWEQAMNSIVNGEDPAGYGSMGEQLAPIENAGVFEEPTRLQKGVSSLNKILADNDKKFGYQAWGGV